MLDLHFNGYESPVHAIVPHNRRQDDRGPLSSGYVAGRIPDDVAPNNGLDVAMAAAISASIVNSIDGMRLIGATSAIRNGDPATAPAGVMLENRSGVGNNDGNPPDNARLAMMAAPAPYRMNCVRITVEHGGINDAKKADFFNRCADAAFRAVDPILQARYGEVVPTPDPDPEVPPTGDTGVPSLAAWAFGEAEGYQFDPNGPVSKLWLAIGAVDGEYPRLVDVIERDDSRYFLFADGMLIRDTNGVVDQVKDILA
jgi:hypothetical protein